MTKQEFKTAKALDERDAAAFKQAFEGHVREGIGLHGPETFGYVTDYLTRTLELMERAAAIGGDWEEEMRVLEAALVSFKEVLNSHRPEAAATVERAINLHGLQIGNPFLAQSSRTDCPFSLSDMDEWLRALLSEDEETIEHTAEFAGGLGMKIMEKARAILAGAVRDGLPPIDARRKLGLLEQGYSKGETLRHTL